MNEIDVRRVDADSRREGRNSAQPPHDDEHLLNANLLAGELRTPEQFAAKLGISVRTLHRAVLGRTIFYLRCSALT